MGCDQELDVSPKLEPNVASYFQKNFGILTWMAMLGSINITIEVSLLSSHVALTRERGI